jgi:hypothetical protein
MSADLIGDDACREAFNKARQQRFSVHGLDVVCEPDIFRSGYAAGRDSEIAKRDARMAELEKELQAGATAVENCELFRAELAAIKAQEPAFMWHKGATEDESEVVDVDCACPCCVPLYAAPVSEAKAQGVVMPEQDGSDAQKSFWAGFEAAKIGPAHWNIRAAWNEFKSSEQFKRLNSAPVQQVSVPDDDELSDLASSACQMALAHGIGEESFMVLARTVRDRCTMLAAAPAAPAADGWISVSERLPGEDDQVLCWCEDETVAWAEVSSHHNSFFTDMTHELLPVTHWMPLPAAPSANSAKGVV